MTLAVIRNLVLASMATAALSACEPGANPFTPKEKPAEGTTAGSDAAAPAATSVRLVDRDVEAPEVFQVNDEALWDGRPSLGGVWVASPDAVDPERVILRNPANGKFVIGALFRRERDNPGPKLQISSDAAAALGHFGRPTGQAERNRPAPRRSAGQGARCRKPILDAAETVTTTSPWCDCRRRNRQGKRQAAAPPPPPFQAAPSKAPSRQRQPLRRRSDPGKPQLGW